MDALDLARDDELAPERLINRFVVAERLGCDPSTLAKMVKTGRFIAPVMIGKMPRWREADVNAWIAERAAEAQRRD